MYVRTYIHLHTYVCMYIYIRTYVCMSTYSMYVCMYVCTSTYVCMYVCMYIYICIYVCMYLCLILNIRSDTSDEMCNFYIMYYTTNDDKDLSINTCLIGRNSPFHLPPVETVSTKSKTTPTTSTTTPVTPMIKPTKPPMSLSNNPPKLEMSDGWILNGMKGKDTSPILSVTLGQVSAVQVDSHGDVLVLHRGSRAWDMKYVCTLTTNGLMLMYSMFVRNTYVCT